MKKPIRKLKDTNFPMWFGMYAAAIIYAFLYAHGWFHW